MTMLYQYNVFSQQNAHNGKWFSPYGEIRIFMVFADIVDDTNTSPVPLWDSGCLPEYADEIIDDYTSENFSCYISRYYSEASFGAFRVTGDYYPNLIELNNNDISGVGLEEVVEYLNDLPENDIVTHNGHHLTDFDRWSSRRTPRCARSWPTSSRNSPSSSSACSPATRWWPSSAATTSADPPSPYRNGPPQAQKTGKKDPAS